MDLNHLYHRFNNRQWLELDPLGIISPSLSSADFELVSFIVAGLSYGRVEQIRKSSEKLWKQLENCGIEKNGSGLAAFLTGANEESFTLIESSLQGWSHRLNVPRDLVAVFRCLSRTLKKYGSLCRMYQSVHKENARAHIEAFAAELLGEDAAPAAHKKKTWKGTGPSWFACSPSTGSSCKRLMMWFRWMIRADNIDPGVWQSDALVDDRLPAPSTARLYWPVDTHVLAWAKSQGIVKAKSSANWKSVEAITDYFRAIEPEDPLRFDFAICHLGISALRKISAPEAPSLMTRN